MPRSVASPSCRRPSRPAGRSAAGSVRRKARCSRVARRIDAELEGHERQENGAREGAATAGQAWTPGASWPDRATYSS